MKEHQIYNQLSKIDTSILLLLTEIVQPYSRPHHAVYYYTE